MVALQKEVAQTANHVWKVDVSDFLRNASGDTIWRLNKVNSIFNQQASVVIYNMQRGATSVGNYFSVCTTDK